MEKYPEKHKPYSSVEELMAALNAYDEESL